MILSYCQNAFEQFTLSVLRKGKVPRHVGFILDGNRRFARKLGASSTKFGHYEGFKQLEKVLDLCMQLGIEAVTVYAFSLENFKRSKDEVDYLMQLFCDAFEGFCEKNALIDKYEISVRFLGNIDLLPQHVQDLTKKVTEQTKKNKKRIFNVCCPYTSRDEMTTAIKNTIEEVNQGHLRAEDITDKTIQNHLFTSDCPSMDILVRTSGEVRLSDFMLWQASDQCQIQFVDCYWPEFSFWRFLPILLEYQIYSDHQKQEYILSKQTE
ncbi:di-trans,poly-cis-decaprenylcistransferase [Gilbertella persicaria]|uniref:di-trans,poly-cis-decaprenylcistransferase n=1 Tax=Gilbertella persicaria TaxID=101096 RepID=UPI002220FE1F|nr:di-trans,poly-cis-decaprenylcistransferase [Gilbertella persicaria]KAI8075918.1 di-trans,poly-cis-decaprenylcistransferase [Gilbertella persicaria]